MRKKGIMTILLACTSALWLSACSGGNAGQSSSAPSSTTAVAAGETETGAQGADPSEESVEEEERGIFESFTATDLDGNPITEEIFKDHELTMINVWATFCGPCLIEMPDLGELSAEYQDKGVQIIGICTDTVDIDGTSIDSMVEEAREIIATTGADYLHVIPQGNLFGMLLPQIQVVPTTIFVDSEGKQVGRAILRVLSKEEWIEQIDERLGQ